MWEGSERQTQQVASDLFLFKWLQSLFAQCFPIDTLARLWDRFLYEGTGFLFRTALAILRLLQPVIEKMPLEDTIALLTCNVRMKRVWNETVSRDALAGMGGAAATGAAVGLGTAAGIASNMASTRAPQRPLAQLVDVVSGESHSITSAQVTIGRERSVSDIALRDPNVSRRHAQLTFTGSDWSIEDLNSTNGTLVNNRRITRCPLRNGDLLTFGLSTFEFRG